MKILTEKYNKTKSFLLDYANGKYGKCGGRIDITKDVVEKFMLESEEENLDEVLSYLNFETEMLENMYGAEDLEDYVDYVIEKTE